MDLKNELAEALRDKGGESFKKLLLAIVNKDVDFVANADSLARAEQEHFCGKLLSFCEGAVSVLNLDDNDDDDASEFGEMESESIKDLKLIASVTSIYQEFSHRPSTLLMLIQQLHDLLIPLSDRNANVQSLKQSISRICENWWIKEEKGAENLITQLIPFLMLHSLSPNSKDTEIKRVYNIRTSILLLDFEDPSIESIRGLLLRCFLHPAYLKVPEGKKFLSFLFSVNPGLHALMIGVMQPQLAAGSRLVASAYGDVLYRAWKEEGNDQLKLAMEESVQSFIHQAIHAADTRYFRSLRILLGTFHDSKRVKGVDSMLLRVYGPIIWRSLRCANAIVRAQATIIFFDTFPLQNEEAGAAETDALLQKQFDLFGSLLRDTDHRVRAAAASGVCHVLRDYWPVIPAAVTRQTLAFLVGTLSQDAASSPVRLAVVMGIGELLEQPLSHVVAQGVLPALANSIHDTSERVRVAFIQVLCKVKNIRGLTFYDIVSVEHLLSRLAEDEHRSAVCSAMAELLLNSFFPQQDDAAAAEGLQVEAERIRRCYELIQQNQRAAVALYKNIHKFAGVRELAGFCVVLFSFFLKHMTEKSSGSSRKSVAKKKQKDGKEAAALPPPAGAFNVSLQIGFLRVLDACLSSVNAKALAKDKASFALIVRHFSPESIQTAFRRLAIASASDPEAGVQLCTRGIPTFLKIATRVRDILAIKGVEVDMLDGSSIVSAYVHASSIGVAAGAAQAASKSRSRSASSIKSKAVNYFSNAYQNYAIAIVKTLVSSGEEAALVEAVARSFQVHLSELVSQSSSSSSSSTSSARKRSSKAPHAAHAVGSSRKHNKRGSHNKKSAKQRRDGESDEDEEDDVDSADEGSDEAGNDEEGPNESEVLPLPVATNLLGAIVENNEFQDIVMSEFGTLVDIFESLRTLLTAQFGLNSDHQQPPWGESIRITLVRCLHLWLGLVLQLSMVEEAVKGEVAEVLSLDAMETWLSLRVFPGVLRILLSSSTDQIMSESVAKLSTSVDEDGEVDGKIGSVTAGSGSKKRSLSAAAANFADSAIFAQQVAAAAIVLLSDALVLGMECVQPILQVFIEKLRDYISSSPSGAGESLPPEALKTLTPSLRRLHALLQSNKGKVSPDDRKSLAAALEVVLAVVGAKSPPVTAIAEGSASK